MPITSGIGRPQCPGGCDFLENPSLDARTARLAWLPDPTGLVGLARDEDEAAPDMPRFSLWNIPGRKSLVHDGRRLLLTSEIGDRLLRLAVAAGLGDGEPFAYAIRAGDRQRESWRRTEALIATAAEDLPLPLDDDGPALPTRSALVHMRTLQTLDGLAAGASQREIAAVLFGAERVAARWQPDSELRAQLRYFVKRGRAYVAGEYRALLGHAD